MSCSLRPSAKFPRPSNEFGLMPRKSLTRGRATEISLSRNSHIRSPRKVTLAPTGIPSRILNPAMLLRALRICGFWPVIFARSSIAPSRARLFWEASPTPMLTTIFSSRGTRMGFSMPNLSLRAGAISSVYWSFSLAIYVLPGLLGDADLLPRVGEPVADPGRLPGVRIHQHHVRDVYRGGEGVEPLLVVLGGSRMARADVDAAHHDPVLPGENPLDLAPLAFLLAGDHHHGVSALY